MKAITKLSLVFLTASVMTSAAFAETADERLQSAKGSVEALTVTLENMGADVNANVDLNGAYTFDQKAAVYNQKHVELQDQFNALNSQISE